MTDLDTLIAAHPDAVTSVRTHDGHVVSHTVIVDTDTGRQAHTFDAGLVERTIDHGDGTGIHEFYDSEGNITGQELLSGLEPWADEPEIPTVAEAMSKLKSVTSLAQVRSAAGELELALAARGIS